MTRRSDGRRGTVGDKEHNDKNACGHFGIFVSEYF
jgi:hypothetical protein